MFLLHKVLPKVTFGSTFGVETQTLLQRISNLEKLFKPTKI